MNRKKNKNWSLKQNAMAVSITALVFFVIDTALLLITEYPPQFLTIFLCFSFLLFVCTLFLQIYTVIKSKIRSDSVLFGLFAGGSLAALLLLSLYSVPQFAYYAISCGQAPVTVNYYFGSRDITYARFGDDATRPGAFDRFVCTEQEAIDLGAKYKSSL